MEMLHFYQSVAVALLIMAVGALVLWLLNQPPKKSSATAEDILKLFDLYEKLRVQESGLHKKIIELRGIVVANAITQNHNNKGMIDGFRNHSREIRVIKRIINPKINRARLLVMANALQARNKKHLRKPKLL